MAGIAMATVEPFVDCSEDLGNPERLRARAAYNGYLFFPGLLPAAEVLAVRHACWRWLKSTNCCGRTAIRTRRSAARASTSTSNTRRTPLPQVRNFYNAVLGLRSFNAFFHHPTVVGVLDDLFGEPLFVHPRVICPRRVPGPPRAHRRAAPGLLPGEGDAQHLDGVDSARRL